MKIIHIVLGKANPNRMNGVNKLVCEMLSAQHSLGYDVQLWGFTKEPIHNYPNRNFNTVLFPTVPNKLRLHHSIKDALVEISEKTVFHLHGSFIPEFYRVGRILRKIGIPYVYTPHGALAPAALNRRGLKKKIYLRLYEKKLIENCSCLIATGVSVFENASKLAKIRRLKLIHNGQNLIETKNVKKNNEEIIFGYCGRIAIEHKGLDLLLKGYKIYKDNGGIASLHLIGDGTDIHELKSLANKLGILNYIKFYGARFGGEKFEILSSFDVFLHTSRMEGFPAAVLEAAACGLPLLVSKHTNVWDYVSKYNCGILIDPNTPAEISRQMAAYDLIHKTSGLLQMQESSRIMIKELFDWDVICKKYYNIYCEALTSNNSI